MFLPFLTFPSCSNREMAVSNNGCEHTITINKDLIKNNRQYSQILKNPTFVQLDTSKNALYGDIGAITIHNDTIYIFDYWYTKSLFTYTIEGEFINKISRIGRGPTEYTSPIDFYVNASNGNISILDWLTKKILTYNKSGRYINEIRFPDNFTSFSFLGTSIYGLNQSPTSPNDHLLKSYDLNGKPYLSGLPAQNMICDGTLNLTLGRDFVELNDIIRFYISEKNMVYSIKKDTITTFIKLEYSNDLLKNEKKPPILYAYSENGNCAFFKLNIGNLPYDVFYNTETSDIYLISPTTIDDITRLPITLLGIWENRVIGRVESQSISYLNELLYRGEITDPIFENYVTDYKSDILVLYDIACH